MKVIQSAKEMQAEAEELHRTGKKIGFVPTMGFLHEGHLSLVRIARKRCDVCVVSVYVNPAQFGRNEDLDSYPSDKERDIQLLENEQVDILFLPDNEGMYPPGYLTYVQVEDITEVMCGEYRPGHFRGVATVVAKLFNIVKPDCAVFGEKDYQQSVVIRRMARDLNFGVEILTGPIVREKDGLAMSSRNSYLSSNEREDAVALYQSLCVAKEALEEGEKNLVYLREKIRTFIDRCDTLKTQYVYIADPDTLQPKSSVSHPMVIAVAVHCGKTRLIDNMIIQ